MGDVEHDRHNSPVEDEPEEGGARLIDLDLAELQREREEAIRRTATELVDQLISYEVSVGLAEKGLEQLMSVGVDATKFELLAVAADIWQRRHSRRSPPAGGIETLAAFVAAAVASGIIGNLSYDALKGVLHRLSRQPSRPHSEPARRRHGEPEPELEEVVLFAVAEQCRRYQLHVDPSKLRVRRWQLSDDAAIAMVDAKGSELTAEVAVPYTSWRIDGLFVRIRDVSQSAEIGRAAESLYKQDPFFFYQLDDDEADDPYAHVGRNAPCPCGSGKRFKMCHGRPGAV